MMRWKARMGAERSTKDRDGAAAVPRGTVPAGEAEKKTSTSGGGDVSVAPGAADF